MEKPNDQTPAINPSQGETGNKKLEQFMDELNGLQKRYQYSIKPRLIYKETGVEAGMSVVDNVPPRKIPEEAPEPRIGTEPKPQKATPKLKP